MKMLKLFFLMALLGLSVNIHAQDFDEDVELIEEAEEIPPPEPPQFDEDNGGDAFQNPEPGFQPSSRFRPNNNADTASPPPPTSNRPSRFGGGQSSFGNRGGGSSAPKLSVPGGANKDFATAQPEDINNKNFPDIVESFDFKDAPIADVVTAMGRLTGKNLIIESGLTGKITITAPTKVTMAEAWEAFLAALAINDFTIVPMGKFLKIRKIDKAKNDSIETYSGAYYPTGDQLITRIMRLKYINAADIQKSFERVIKSKNGQMVAYEKTNSLIITDLGSSVERMSRILEELDKPGFEERLEVIPIRHAKAKDLADLIDKIINKGEDKNKTRTFRPSSRFSNEQKDESLSLVSPDERTNSIIVVGNKEGIARISTLVKQLDYPLDASEAGSVHVYYVKHGDAKKIEETINGIAQETEKKSSQSNSQSNSSNPATFTPPQQKQQMFGGDVVMKADENTNSLIITASKQDYKTVLSLLEKIDIPKDQVYVQAYIVEMKVEGSDLWEAGVVKFAGAQPVGSSTTGDGGLARIGYNFGGLTDVVDITKPGSVLTFGSKDLVNISVGGNTVPVPNLLGFLNFLKTKGDANILSTPQIMAMDNEESYIEVGDEIPVGLNTTTAVGSTPQNSVQFKDATILLKIKPFISPDSDVVRMEIEQKVNDISSKTPKAAQLAAISQGLTKRTVKTNLTLSSGETAVLGGLMQDSDSIQESKIPILGDIPVLGWLFKRRKVDRIKTNLMVFLTPKIIRNASDHKKLTRTKLNERVDWIKKNANGRDPFGTSLESLAKYADSGDEFKLEDQPVFEPQPIDQETPNQLDQDMDEMEVIEGDL